MSNSISFDRAATYYDDTRGFPPGIGEQVGAFIAQCASLSTESHVLEVGVGTGRIAIPLSAHVGHFIGVDLSRKMMNRLQQKTGNGNVHLAETDITQLPFASQSFDAVIAVHVLHLIPEWQHAISELARVLRPDAVLLTCWDEANKDQKMALLSQAWSDSVPDNNPVGIKPDEYETYLPEHGWQKGALHIFPYTVPTRLSGFINRLKNRVWSRTWSMTDSDIENGIAAVEAVIAAYFDDPDAVLEVEHGFYVQVWRLNN